MLSTKLSNGWNIAKVCFRMLNAHKQLIIFPILSIVSLLLIIFSFFQFTGNDIAEPMNEPALYAFIFISYFIGYFIIVFFNVALVHCTMSYFDGKDVSVGAGLSFSMSRINVIFTWAIFAATVGTVLKFIQNNLGVVGKVITGIIGFIWSISTFFIVPIIAYEDLGPVDAFRRSATMMREKWGDSLAASFSFGVFQVVGLIILLIITVFVIEISEGLAAVVFAAGIVLISVIVSTLQAILMTAVYYQVNGNTVPGFNSQQFDNLFEQKDRKLF